VSYPEPPNGPEHTEDLLLSYVEGLLEPEDHTRVTQHLLRCPRCSTEVDGLKETISILKKTRPGFCPAPWQVFEFLHYGHDPDSVIASHLHDCPSCARMAATLSAHAPAEEMPSDLLNKITVRLQHPEQATGPLHRWRSGLVEGFSRLFRVPALAAGAVAAAVLLVVILYPHEMPQSVVALSSVTWDGTPRPKSFDQSRKRVAILVALKGFDSPMTQQRIDSFYESLAPTMELYERFSVISPGVIRETVSKGWARAQDRSDLLAGIKGSLDVSEVVFVTVEAGTEGASVVTELIDTTLGIIMAQGTLKGVSDADLERTIRQSAFSMLLAPSHENPVTSE